MDLLYWLFLRKGVMPWAAYDHIRRPGFRDVVRAFAEFEIETRAKK